MKTYRHEGNIWDHTPGTALTSDQGVIIGTVVGIAVSDIAANEKGAVRVKGVVEFAKPSAETITQGATLNFDETNQEFQLAAGDLAGAGVATADAGAGETTVWVALNPGAA
ncbi:MAG: DUF2190 family protein [Acidimicrobiia bacterium]|nr:DUF2190 family protein [Acidimicrobiia bacterium]